jgi:parvulin-like peptidyl-prolyl isomerase
MMTTLRTQMKTILWILVVAFLGTIVFSWGMGGFKDDQVDPNVIGKIAGEEITYEAFDRFIQRKQELANKDQEAPLDEAKLKQIREDSWDEEVERMLKMKDAERLGLEITDREIAYIVENYPPNEIRQVESFQREGRFAPDLYQAFLRTPDAQQFLIGLEASVRNYLIEQKLAFQVNQASDISELAVKDEYFRASTTGKLRFVFVAYDKVAFDSSEITDDMLRRYYQLFPDRFKQYAQRRFAYTKFKLEPSAEDSSEVQTLAQELMDEIRRGADFAELAKQHSEDQTSAEKGGELDWFGKGAMAKQFEEAAMAATPGELVGPVESKFGIHIIRVEEKKVEEGEWKIRARHILLKYKASPDTRDAVYSVAYAFGQDAEQSGFDQAVEASSLRVDTTKTFSEAGYIGGLGRMRMAAEFCFNNPVGTVSSVYPVPDGYVVFKIVEATEESTKPFEDVRESVAKSVTKILKNQKAGEIAASMRARMASPDDLLSVAVAEGYPVYTTEDSLKPDGKLPEGLRNDKDFMSQAFRLDEGELSEVIEGKNGCYIVHMTNKTPFNSEEYESNHFVVYASLYQKETEAVNKNWVRELRIAGNIEDLRYKFYRDF